MLTIKEINEVSFGKAGFSGYKPEDVDNFIDAVVESFKEMENEKQAITQKAAQLAARNTELQEKLSILAEKIETYRQDEDGIKDALITAQVAARGAVKDAEKKAEIILANAEHQAKSKVNEAEQEHKRLIEEARSEAVQIAQMYASQIDMKKKELEEIKKQVTAFRSSLLEMYKKHLDCIDHIPNFRQKDIDSNNMPAQTPQQSVVVPQNKPEQPPVHTETVEENQQAQYQTVQQDATTEFETISPLQEQQSHQPQKQVLPKTQPANTSPQHTGRVNRQVAANPMTQKVNYASQRRRPAKLEPNMPDLTVVSDDLTDVGINTTTFNSIPEPLLNEKRAGYSNLEFGEGVDVTTR